MSFEAVLWATNDAPIANVNEFAVLMMLAEKADPDGCNAFPSRPTIAARTTVNSKTVLRALQSMEARGLIAEGDQRAAQYIRADRRPVVYDLLIPYSWFPNVDRINRERQERGRTPLTMSTRPDIAPAPEKKTRSDKGTKRPKQTTADQQESSRGDFESPRDADGYGVTTSPGRGDYESATGGLQVTQTSPVTQSLNLNNPVPPSVVEAEVSCACGSSTDGRTDGSGDVVEDQEQTAANAPETDEATTASNSKVPSPGETLLRRIGRHHPEISAGLAMGSTLADQGRVVNMLLAAGITHEEIRSVLLDRPYPEPSERTHTMASLIAGRLARIPLPPIAYSSQLPAQASPSSTAAWPEVSRAQSLPTPPATHRSCEGEIGTAFCERLALPGTRLCARCTKNAGAATAQAPEGPDAWQQAVAAAVGSVQA
ncbi:helix-turn-helix domain-containing protein [Streptomyces sp. NPDC057298]|uniref:helix-turn-helix domain-containing protein n=1 Tax=Streptomyces sp. NPDC057298 TaxID=3346091 RepID=UPI00363D2B9A